MKETLRQHLDEMATGRSGIYRLLVYMEDLEIPPEEGEAILKEAAAIAEFVLWQELSVKEVKLEAAAQSLLDLPGIGKAQSLAGWRKALEGGIPSRPSCQLMLDGFAELLARVPEALRPAVVEALPSVARFLADIKPAGLDEIVEALISLEPTGHAEKYLETLSAYSDTDAVILQGASRLSYTALTAGSPELIDRLKKAVTLEMMLESNDACRLLPAAAKLCKKCDALKAGSGAIALNLAVVASEHSPSSAYSSLRSLEKTVSNLPAEKAESLLKSVTTLVDRAGIRTLGTALKLLPKLYSGHSVETVEAFVNAAAESGERYGTTSAEWFLLRKTKASRETL
ncbi:MAG: hypothetical protein QGI24_05310 [Kiritimatiellia bacterium]|jgi:hypothetical protein|nr:hypothetical protein [Kiritimatiellia bacterium]MDP6848187.1 hypothetical protein [Kiritimatiellia bacterium]